MRRAQPIGHRIRLRDLQILLEVSKTGSMGKAAGSLAVSQPVVSKAIADLEAALDVRLLDRTPRGAEPTLYGQALLNCGIAVFDELQHGIEAIEFLANPGAGELRLGCTEPLAAGFVGAVIERLARDHPGIAFRVVTGDPLSLKERELRQRTIEFAITPTEGLVPDPQIEAELLFEDRQVVVVGNHHKWARRRSIGLEALVAEPWFLPPTDSIIGSYIGSAFRAAGLEPPRPQVESFSVPLCHHLVASGRFIAMLPVSMVALGMHLPLKLLRLESPTVPRPTAILALKNRTLSPLATLFTARARELAKQLASLA